MLIGPFDLWDLDDQCHIRSQMFVAMTSVAERMYVILEEEQQVGGAAKRRRCDKVGGSASYDLMPNLHVEPP